MKLVLDMHVYSLEATQKAGREASAPAMPAASPAPAPTQPKPSASGSEFDDMDDDIPF